MKKNYSFNWCRDEYEAKELADLFVKNLSSNYISHSELQGKRATSVSEWSENIDSVIESDFQSRINNKLDIVENQTTSLLASLKIENTISGVFLITFSREANVPYAILEDMMISPSLRGLGYGEKFMNWINSECELRNINRLFLESGVNNEKAHHFFEKENFQKISVVMMKELSDKKFQK